MYVKRHPAPFASIEIIIRHISGGIAVDFEIFSTRRRSYDANAWGRGRWDIEAYAIRSRYGDLSEGLDAFLSKHAPQWKGCSTALQE
jgi:hypothetical protein